MKRVAYLVAGYAVLVLGGIGVVLPTVPFVILAAFCFARSSPALERRLVEHRRFGPHIRHWRKRGAITRKEKRAAPAPMPIPAGSTRRAVTPTARPGDYYCHRAPQPAIRAMAVISIATATGSAASRPASRFALAVP